MPVSPERRPLHPRAVAICGGILFLATIVEFGVHSITTFDYRFVDLWAQSYGPLLLARLGLTLVALPVYPLGCFFAYQGSRNAQLLVLGVATLRGLINASPLGLLEFFPALYVGRDALKHRPPSSAPIEQAELTPARATQAAPVSIATPSTRGAATSSPRGKASREQGRPFRNQSSRARLASGRKQMLLSLWSLLGALLIRNAFSSAPLLPTEAESLRGVTLLRDWVLFGGAAVFAFRGGQLARLLMSFITVSVLFGAVFEAELAPPGFGLLVGHLSGPPLLVAIALCLLGEALLLGAPNVRYFLQHQRRIRQAPATSPVKSEVLVHGERLTQLAGVSVLGAVLSTFFINIASSEPTTKSSAPNDSIVPLTLAFSFGVLLVVLGAIKGKSGPRWLLVALSLSCSFSHTSASLRDGAAMPWLLFLAGCVELVAGLALWRSPAISAFFEANAVAESNRNVMVNEPRES